MATYKTPGVYVEEISKFPPSVAQVETAIPAFIGYTEKAEKRNGDSLSLKPTRIKSLLEYETYFGRAEGETTIVATITDNVQDGVTTRSMKVAQPSTKSKFSMFYAMQIYFANGGGPCYIVSVGDYSAGVTLSKLEDGLAATRKEDEPTLLLFPDATSLSTVSDFYAIYNSALTQCSELQDRFTIIDTYSDDEVSGTPIEDLRLNITSDIQYAKYGAVYYPYLETILDYQYAESDVSIVHKSNDGSALRTIETNVGRISDPATGMPKYVDELFAYDSMADSVSGDVADVMAHLYGTFDVGGTLTVGSVNDKDPFLIKTQAVEDNLALLIQWKYNLIEESIAAEASDDGSAATIAAARTNFNADFEGPGKLEEIYANLVELNDKLEEMTSLGKVKNILNSNNVNFQQQFDLLVQYTNLDTGLTTGVPTVDLFANIPANMQALIDQILLINDVNDGSLNGRSLANIQDDDNTVYNQIKTEIAALPITLPPSAAMAGVYARTDANVGVWKAPANTSLNYVIKPSVLISGEDQADLNVHTTGKSVNAIRSFIGKGTLVWGARTLAGNDNEWRYVPVRRFFNMVEESVNKASEQFVFESNDANTWVKMRAMIENFLNLQWKAGALAGSKPEQAYYVRVGLGQTMTAQDILEGRMIIEIGMAAVRPAEFIILRFSHKMQEA